LPITARLASTCWHIQPGATAKVIYGLITGIGFIGGGAILKHRTRPVA
jgi:uncharacterized membrane protein YhiD involved in acid resistance